MSFDRYDPFLAVKIQKILFVKLLFFFWVIDGSNDPTSTHVNGKRVPNSKSARQITPGGTQKQKMTYAVIKGH